MFNYSHWNKKKLQLVLTAFFFALAIPTGILIKQSYSQLKWEAFHHYRLQAEELVSRIDLRYKEIIKTESVRPFTDYTFLNITGNIQARALQRSPLSNFPINKKFPGIIGYFQIDNNGGFTTPLLPTTEQLSLNQDYRLSKQDKNQRLKLQNKIYQILNENKLVVQSIVEKEAQDEINEQLSLQASSLNADNIAPQTAFDQLQDSNRSNTITSSAAQGRIEDLKFKKKYIKQERKRKISKAKEKRQQKRSRRENNVLPDYPKLLKKDKTLKQNQEILVKLFESEISNFEFSLLESGHFVLYRTVWRNGLRFIQGILINPELFINKVTADSFYKINVSKSTELTFAYQGNILSTLEAKATPYTSRLKISSKQDLQGTLLLQKNLSSTLEKIELIFSVNNLPSGPGGQIIIWLSIILLLILCGGFFILYLLALKQLSLASQQQNFISAVSHELKTPLTSIHMYGEILREGWATEEKKKQYYDFIFDESERLTRLINNVLQLAKINKNEFPVALKEVTIPDIIDNINSKTNSQIERAGFKLKLTCNTSISSHCILVDTDYFIQIMINLVDNAIKFSSKANKKQIDIHCDIAANNKVQFSIRDYGPGINKKHINKIFNLFYRPENELTRETVGTGIGLSLVKQLVTSMYGEIEIHNKEPGVEFIITFNKV
ncbi:MAG: ATP-binding protein [Woeseiaceae bacterium]